MNRQKKSGWLFMATAVLTFAASANIAEAQTRVVRVAKQYGISYLPLTIIEETIAARVERTA